jgi:hypothetical protein
LLLSSSLVRCQEALSDAFKAKQERNRNEINAEQGRDKGGLHAQQRGFNKSKQKAAKCPAVIEQSVEYSSYDCEFRHPGVK